MKTAFVALLLAMWAALLPGQVLADGTNVGVTWSPGWDYLNRPLDYAHSVAHLDESASTHQVKIAYALREASPNATHVAGVHLFWGPAGTPSLGKCLRSFGQFGASNCAYACRQGMCRTYNSFELCRFTTDAQGNGGCSVIINGVRSG